MDNKQNPVLPTHGIAKALAIGTIKGYKLTLYMKLAIGCVIDIQILHIPQYYRFGGKAANSN